MTNSSDTLQITLVRSLIGRPQKQHAIIKGLGLGRVGSTVTRKNTPAFRGMIKKVLHLVHVEASHD